MKSTTTLALDLEGTLISHASTMVPRSGLYDFLAFCHQQFERIVFLSFVDQERGRKILNMLADSGHMPEWVKELIEVGFLKLVCPGGILNGRGCAADYTLSKTWRDWQPPPPDTRNITKARAARKKK